MAPSREDLLKSPELREVNPQPAIGEHERSHTNPRKKFRGPKKIYRTPLVLGISVPPVRSIACLKASARALKADSALGGRGSDNVEDAA